MSLRVYDSTGRLREEWDTGTRMYTAWNASGVQTEQRPFTAAENARTDAEIAAALLETNRSTIEAQAATALADNTAYIAVTNPTNAQNAAQVKALTRQNNKIIRLLLGRLDGTD